MTGSAWIVDNTGENILLTHHAKLNRWLQPGGHADGDEDILNVAQREAEEETGLKCLTLMGILFSISISTPFRHETNSLNTFITMSGFYFRLPPMNLLSVTEESHALALEKTE
jgi:8-oxo-dGTP pyrophosphatase MutT (NUDIX family)